MDASPDHDRPSSPRAFMLLPVALALHVAEEWSAGFAEWASLALNVDIEINRFLAINLAGLVLFVFGAATAYRNPRAAWIGVSLAALVGVNAIAHTVLSFVLKDYSPGTVTGLLLYLPLCIIIFRWAAAHQPRSVLVGAILFGIGFHAVATLSATL